MEWECGPTACYNSIAAIGERLMVAPAIDIPKQALADFCRRHGIRKLSLFGSVLRDDFRPDSDVDVLVEFEPGTRVGLMGLAGVEIAPTVRRPLAPAKRRAVRPPKCHGVKRSECATVPATAIPSSTWMYCGTRSGTI